MIESKFYFLTHLWSKLSPEQVTSGYTTEEDCKKWPREVLFALLFMFFISWSHFSIFISPCFCFFSFSIQPLPITQVCTISKETKRKFNPVTKCEKVREVPCKALETETETFKRNKRNNFFSDPSRIMRTLWLWFCSGPWDLPRWGLIYFLLLFYGQLNLSAFFLNINILIFRRRPS